MRISRILRSAKERDHLSVTTFPSFSRYSSTSDEYGTLATFEVNILRTFEKMDSSNEYRRSERPQSIGPINAPKWSLARWILALVCTRNSPGMEFDAESNYRSLNSSIFAALDANSEKTRGSQSWRTRLPATRVRIIRVSWLKKRDRLSIDCPNPHDFSEFPDISNI